METEHVGDIQRLQSGGGWYESVEKFVWVLKIEGTYNEDKIKGVLTLTAFVVHPGHLLTCPYSWGKWDGVKFKAKPLRGGRPNFWYDADLVAIRREADLCLLKLKNCQEANNVASLGSGNLAAGDPILLIGHAEFFVGSGMLGCVNYPCTENPVFGFQSSRQTCKTYICNALAETPAYRIMGHLWNKGVFARLGPGASKHEYDMNRLAEMPILQCSALVGGCGTSGGPLFNKNGEVVGMLVGDTMGPLPYQIGIHVFAIKLFLEDSLKGKGKGKGEGKGKGKGKDEGVGDECPSQEEKSEDRKTLSKESKTQKKDLSKKSKKQKRGL